MKITKKLIRAGKKISLAASGLLLYAGVSGCPPANEATKTILDVSNLPDVINVYESDLENCGPNRTYSFQVRNSVQQDPLGEVSAAFVEGNIAAEIPYTLSTNSRRTERGQADITLVFEDKPGQLTHPIETVVSIQGAGGQPYEWVRNIAGGNDELTTPIIPTFFARSEPYLQRVVMHPGNSPDGNCQAPIVCRTDSDCNDSNSLTLDSCVNPNTPASYCQNTPAPIACRTDTDCSDANPATTDRCINPNTPASYCQNTTPTIPTEDLFNQVDSYFVNAQGQRFPNNRVTENPVRLRLTMPQQLEQLLVPGNPKIIRTEENGVGDCIDIGSYTALTRTSPGIYDSTVRFTVGQNCLEDEFPAFVSSISTTDGFTGNNFYGSGFVYHGIPQAP